MSANQATILVVDDDKFVRIEVRDSLAEGAYRILEAADGDQALATAANEPVSVVVLDLLMPNRSGMDTLSELRRLHPKTKVLVLTSLMTPSVEAEARGLGAAKVMAKPFHPLEMMEAVRELVGA